MAVDLEYEEKKKPGGVGRFLDAPRLPAARGAEAEHRHGDDDASDQKKSQRNRIPDYKVDFFFMGAPSNIYA